MLRNVAECTCSCPSEFSCGMHPKCHLPPLTVPFGVSSVSDIYTTYWNLYHTSHGTHTKKEGAGEDRRDTIR